MLHELPNKISQSAWGRRLFLGIVTGYLLTQLVLAVRPWLPGQSGARLPWTMFVAAGKNNRSMTFSGITTDGQTIDIDPTQHLRYTRGSTPLRIHDHHPAMWKDKPHHKRDQRVFARWLARQVWLKDGVQLQALQFQRHWEKLASGKIKHGEVHQVAISAEDLEREVPSEARVGSK